MTTQKLKVLQISKAQIVREKNEKTQNGTKHKKIKCDNPH